MTLASVQQVDQTYTHLLTNHQTNTGHSQQVETPLTDFKLAKQQQTPSNNSPLKHLKIFLLRLVEAAGNWVNKLLGKSQSISTKTENSTLREARDYLFSDGEIMDDYISTTSKLLTNDKNPEERLFYLMDTINSARCYLEATKESLLASALTKLPKCKDFLTQVDLLLRSSHALTITSNTGNTTPEQLEAIVNAVNDWHLQVQVLRSGLETAVEEGLIDQQAPHKLHEAADDLFSDGKIMDKSISTTSELLTDDKGPQARLFSLTDTINAARCYLETTKESLLSPVLTTLTEHKDFLTQVDLLQRKTFPGSSHALTITSNTGNTTPEQLEAIVNAVNDWHLQVQVLRSGLETAVEKKLSDLTARQATHLRTMV